MQTLPSHTEARLAEGQDKARLWMSLEDTPYPGLSFASALKDNTSHEGIAVAGGMDFAWTSCRRRRCPATLRPDWSSLSSTNSSEKSSRSLYCLCPEACYGS